MFSNPSTDFTKTKNFRDYKHNLREKNSNKSLENKEDFLDDETVMEISRKIIERNKKVYSELAK